MPESVSEEPARQSVPERAASEEVGIRRTEVALQEQRHGGSHVASSGSRARCDLEYYSDSRSQASSAEEAEKTQKRQLEGEVRRPQSSQRSKALGG